MKRLLSISTVLMLLFVATGCGDSRDSLTQEQLTTMNEVATVMGKITDGPSAKAAKPELKSLMDKMKDIQAREAKLPAATQEEQKALVDKYGKEMDATLQKFTTAAMKIGFDPAIRAELDDLDMRMK